MTLKLTRLLLKHPEPPEEIEGVREVSAAPPTRGWLARLKQLGGGVVAMVWVGLFVAAVGFGILGFSWSRVAGMLDVGRQMPYLISGGLTSVCLVLAGLTLVHIGAARRDALEQANKLDRLGATLQELRRLVESEDGTPSGNGAREELPL